MRPLWILLSCPVLMTAQDPQPKHLQAKLDEIRIHNGFPGATFALLAPGVNIEQATGFADPVSGIRMSPSSRMFSGSTGKTFASALALQLKGEGKLDFDSKLSVFFPHADWFSKIPNSDHLTVRMCLQHTTGLPRYELMPEFWKALKAQPDRVWKPEECLAFVHGKAVLHEPGKGWSYADTNYLLLGLVMEKVLGKPYLQELQRRILKPLELQRTLPSDSRVLPGLVQGHTGDGVDNPFLISGAVLNKGRYPFNPSWEWTGGGLLTNSLDLATWAQALYGGRILSKARLQELLQPLDEKTGKPASTGYGLGVQVATSDLGLDYGHGGIFPGYETYLIYLPSLKAAAAIQINADRLSGKLKQNPRSMLLELLQTAFPQRGKP